MLRTLAVVLLVSCSSPQTPRGGPRNEGGGPGTAPATAQRASGDTARWIEELANPRTAERAIQELEQLGDPAAIVPLGNHFLADRTPYTLRVIVSIAAPLTPGEAKAKNLIAYESSGRPASWPQALPFLREAIARIDAGDPRSIDTVVIAADAIGAAQLTDASGSLITLAEMPPDKKLLVAQVAAIRALGKLPAAKPKVVPALAKLVAREPPAHPRTARDRDVMHVLEERFTLHLAITGAAINALAELHAESAVGELVRALYITPELASQLRRALVAAGPAAKAELEKVLLGKHAEIERLFAERKLDRYCGDKGEVPAAQCQPTSAKDFYAATVLGDFHDPATATALLAALDRPAVPAYYIDEAPGPSQHAAVFDALRKLGAPAAAAPLLKLWQGKKTDVQTKGLAAAAYAFAARDQAGVDDLAKIMSDNNAADELRIATASAFARLATKAQDISPLLSLAARYLDASDKKRLEADRKKPATEKADAELAGEKKRFEDLRSALLDLTKDPDASAAEIRAATERLKLAERDFKEGRKRHRETTSEHRGLEAAAQAYLGYARMFQMHAARVEVAIRCKSDVRCFTSTLSQRPETAAGNIKRYIRDVDTWSAEDKLGLVEANIDRAMLELGKLGPKATVATGELLEHVKSDNRVIRQAILLALPKLAPRPCPACVEKLDAAIAAGEGKTTLGDLDMETTLLRSYFTWTK